jgi:hypothetical protein
MLFAVDLTVGFGLVEAWNLSSCVKGPTWYCDDMAMARFNYQIAAFVLLPASVVAAIIAVKWEKLSQDHWKPINAANALVAVPRPKGWYRLNLWAKWLRSKWREPWFRVDRWWLRAAVLRWVWSSVHLAFIIRVPKWDFVQSFWGHLR